MVVFRLTQEEYHALKEACEREGARNVSDFVRAGLLEYLQTGMLSSQLGRRLAALDHQIATLQSQINYLQQQGVLHVETLPR
ncbi:MAG TPA: ribbon-helix-helix protein, CopG family [Bryobacteraceae bacterium]|nr:ribbon-helix-helix protein, CopG family [Bryobacteraceae bacterium]